MKKPSHRINDDLKVIETIAALQNYAFKNGCTPEQMMAAVKRYWGKWKRDKKEAIVKLKCGNCVHNKHTPCKPYYCGHNFVDGRRPKAILKRKGECPAYAGK